MAAVPSLILILLAITGHLLRGRGIRMVQGLTIAGLTSALIALILARVQVGSVVGIAGWRSQSLFGIGVELQLLPEVWPVGIMIVGVLLAATVRGIGTRAHLEARSIAIGGLAVAAGFAANLQTLLLSWTAISGLRLWPAAAPEPDASNRSLRKALWGEAVPLLALLGAAYLNSLEANPAQQLVAWSLLARGTFVAAVLLSVGAGHWLGEDDPSPEAGESRQLGYLLPAAAAVAALGAQTQLDGLAAPRLAWIIPGILGLAWGIRLHFFAPNRHMRWAGLQLSVVSVAALASILRLSSSLEVLAGAGTSLLVVGGIGLLAQVQLNWQRAWLVIAGLVLAGVPGTPGNLVLWAIATQPATAWGLALAALVTLGISSLCASFLLSAQRLEPGLDRPPSGRVLASDVGLLLLLALVGGSSLGRGWLGSASSTVLAVGVIGLAAIMLVLQRHIPRSELISRIGVREARSAQSWGRRLAAPVRLIGSMVRIGVEVFEGAGAVLWMFLAVLIVLLALQSGGS